LSHVDPVFSVSAFYPSRISVLTLGSRRGFFFILAPIWPLDVIDTLLKGKQHFIDQGVLYLPTMAIWTIGSVIAGITASEWSEWDERHGR
jgi:hypothetical protein